MYILSQLLIKHKGGIKLLAQKKMHIKAYYYYGHQNQKPVHVTCTLEHKY